MLKVLLGGLCMIQTELHRHLDVSVRHSTLLRLAQERGLEAQSTSLAAFREKIVLKEPLSDLASVLATFTLFQQVLDRPDVLEQVAFEVVEDCRTEGTRKVELRFSPSFVCELSHLRWADALDGFESGINKAMEKYPDMQAGLICIATREYGNKSVEKTVEFFLDNQERFVGLDLAGNEADFPSRKYERIFREAQKFGANITIHAGEAAGPENIWVAVEDLGASRIGHGIQCVQDSKLMEMLRDRQICLEVCPISNWLTGATPSLEKHPLPQILRAGIPVCINTDDPSVFDTTLPMERKVCRERMGMTPEELDQCFSYAEKHSFIKRKA